MSAVSLISDTEDLALHYEQESIKRQFVSGQVLLGKIGIEPGMKVLDIGCGTGLLAQHVAQMVGSNGMVTGIDPLPLRIDLAKRKSTATLDFFVGDAVDLMRFPEASMDAVYFNSVFHWIKDQPLALRQAFRVMKAGAPLGIASGSADHPLQFHVLKDRVMARKPYSDYAEAIDGQPNNLSAADYRKLCADTGFVVRDISVETTVSYHDSADDIVDFYNASAFGNLFGNLPVELKAGARDALIAEFEAFRTPDGIRQERSHLFAIAAKPGGR